MMRAAYITETGPPESIKLGERPKPEPGPGQVLVRVAATAFNPLDLYLRGGMVAMPIPMPYIVGSDLAGTVEAVGPGAQRFRPGDRVFGSNQGILGRQGVTAEYAAVDEDYLYATPSALTDQGAAALALVGITAHLGLFQFGRLRSGETVYVSGGTGGVGSMVVQMAKIAGARVATSAGGPEGVAMATALGADLALDYKADDVPARLRGFAPDGVDVWFETQREPDFEVSIPLLRRRGRMIVTAGRTAKPVFPLGPFYTQDRSLLGFAMFNATPDEQRVCGDDIARWAAAGNLKPHIGRVFPFDEAAAAQRLLEDNTMHRAGTLRGKVVIAIA